MAGQNSDPYGSRAKHVGRETVRKFLQLFRWDEGGPDQAFQPQERDGVSGDRPEGQSPGVRVPRVNAGPQTADLWPSAPGSLVRCP